MFLDKFVIYEKKKSHHGHERHTTEDDTYDEGGKKIREAKALKLNGKDERQK